MRRFLVAFATVWCVVLVASASAGAAPTVDVITNGGFETGDLSGWSATTTIVNPYCGAWAVDACAPEGPHSGSHQAGNGFDGSPGQYVLSQVVTLPAGTATLSWFDDAWASYGGVPRTLEVQVRDASGTTVLGTPYTYTLPFNAFPPTGWVSHTVDLSAYTGQTVQLTFVQVIPENFTGPASFGIDDISLLVDPAPSNRAGYCLRGTFLDLLAGQPDFDPAYAGATPARFVKGLGITCDPAPAGYVLKGRTDDGVTVGAGMYDLYAAS